MKNNQYLIHSENKQIKFHYEFKPLPKNFTCQKIEIHDLLVKFHSTIGFYAVGYRNYLLTQYEAKLTEEEKKLIYEDFKNKPESNFKKPSLPNFTTSYNTSKTSETPDLQTESQKSENSTPASKFQINDTVKFNNPDLLLHSNESFYYINKVIKSDEKIDKTSSNFIEKFNSVENVNLMINKITQFENHTVKRGVVKAFTPPIGKAEQFQYLIQFEDGSFDMLAENLLEKVLDDSTDKKESADHNSLLIERLYQYPRKLAKPTDQLDGQLENVTVKWATTPINEFYYLLQDQNDLNTTFLGKCNNFHQLAVPNFLPNFKFDLKTDQVDFSLYTDVDYNYISRYSKEQNSLEFCLDQSTIQVTVLNQTSFFIQFWEYQSNSNTNNPQLVIGIEYNYFNWPNFKGYSNSKWRWS